MQSGSLKRLIIRAKKGDKDAFGEIYNLFQKLIFRYIYFSVRNYELAEDLTQNTFFKVWRVLPSISISRGSFRAFLFTIARNLIIDWSRSKKELPLETIENFPSFENPEEDVIRKEAKEVVLQALKRLEENERQLILLRFFEELEYGEIAKVIGKKEGAVRVSTHRILKKMKSYIKYKYEN